jgi:GT2 family glycosyltransferase
VNSKFQNQAHFADYSNKFAAKIPCMNPKVSIGIVLFGDKYLKESLPSLVQQDYENVEFLLVDQEEDKWTAFDFVKRELPEIFNNPRVKIEKGKNLWHSGGHNKLIQKALYGGADYYICGSNDMLYPTDLVSRAIAELEKPEHKKFGSATVKLLRWSNCPPDKGGCPKGREVIDSCGIGMTPGHHFYDVGQGAEDRGQFDQQQEIFGASGALAIFRRKALEDIGNDGEFFDKKLHYKNDIDLAYRLQWFGWKSLFVPTIEVFHDRQLGGESSLFQFFRERKKTARWAKESSLWGHLVILEKNFSSNFSWRTKLATRFYNFKKLIYFIFCEPFLLKQFWKIRKTRAKLQKSRKKVGADKIEKLMN